MSTYDLARVLERLGIHARLRGREWVALCPNHVDHTPSWRLRDEPSSPKHGRHHCFPCGFGGSLKTLVMHMRSCDAREAKRWLDEFGEDDQPAVLFAEMRTASRNMFSLPSGVVLGPLERWVTPARRYAESRGITPEQVLRWGIGYAVDGRLAGRLVVPYRDRCGQPWGYSARSYHGSMRRYLEAESWEHPARHVVFGEQHWPDPADDWVDGVVYVAEGAINALAIERALASSSSGYVLSLAGSNPHPGAIAKVARFGRVVLVTDPDDAGDKVAANFEVVLSRHTATSRVAIPRGQDAATLSKDALRALLEGA